MFGKVQLLYNHYKDWFDIVDGSITFEGIDEKYCFSYVFKGNFSIKLKNSLGGEELPSGNLILNL